jgi:hypothetical protein
LIVRLQDADKIGHAGSIPVFGRNRNLSIGRGLAPLPNPEQEIGDFFHGVLSSQLWWTLITGAATRRSIKRKPAGVTPPTLSCNCRLAGPVLLLCTLH